MSKQVTALTDGEVPEVGLVRRGAQGKRIAATKSEASMPEDMEDILKAVLELEADNEGELEKLVKQGKLDEKAMNAARGALRILSSFKDVMPADMMGTLAKLAGMAPPKQEKPDNGKPNDKPNDKAAHQNDEYPPPKKKSDGSFEFGDNVSQEVREQLTALWKHKEDSDEREQAAIKKNLELEGIIKSERDDRRIKEFITKADTELKLIPGKAEDKGKLLKRLFDLDESAGSEVETILKTLNKQIGESKLYESLGHPMAQSSAALDQINAKAAELQKADPKMKKEVAFAKIVKSHPDLRKAYYAEKGE